MNGREAVTIEYAYLGGSPGGAADVTMPALMHAYDTLILNGNTYEILTFAAEEHELAALTMRRPPLFRNVYGDLLQSWRVTQAR